MQNGNWTSLIGIFPTLTQEQAEGERHQNIHARRDSLSVISEIVLLLSPLSLFLSICRRLPISTAREGG
jgi:hypothetical protein